MAGEVIVERHKRDYCPNAPADILAARQPANMLAAPQLSDSPATQQRSRHIYVIWLPSETACPIDESDVAESAFDVNGISHVKSNFA